MCCYFKVTLAATAVFGYAWLVPAALYATLWWIGGSTSVGKTDHTASFLELLCVYGYSLAIYIPVSVLWTIQISAFQWSLVLVGAGLSGAVLLLAIWPSVQDHAKKIGIILVVIVLVLHILLACGFMLYFFHVPSTSGNLVNPTENKNAGNSSNHVNPNAGIKDIGITTPGKQIREVNLSNENSQAMNSRATSNLPSKNATIGTKQITVQKT